MAEIKKSKESLHIAMYPWFAFGHLTSFLHLANKFAQRGHKISFFLPSKTQPKLASHNHHPNLITFIPIDVPPVDGLPVGAETTADVPASARGLLMEAMDLTQDTIDAHLARLKPDVVIFDFTEWLPGLARKHRARSVLYVSSYLVSAAYGCREGRNIPPGHRVTEADLMRPAPGFPCPAIRLRAHEARSLAALYDMELGKGKKLMERFDIGFRECDAFAYKSCREMEGPYCDFLKKHKGKPLFLAGPVMPEPPATTLDDRLDGWLKGFSKGSVIYCALGSECVLGKDQFRELVLGLELTGRPFLAAIKPPREFETIESALPEGFLERTKGRGIVHENWVQQQLILQHPSIGCFLTHCGAGSLSEAMLSECQLVFLPRQIDQFLNARLMSLDLKVGVEVEKRDDDGSFTRENVVEAITIVMEEQNEVGREVRANHAKLRKLLSKEGIEDSYINKFVKYLQDLLG